MNNPDCVRYLEQSCYPIPSRITLDKLNYMHNNPVKAGIVEKAEEYLSSARDYYHGKGGLLPIERLIAASIMRSVQCSLNSGHSPPFIQSVVEDIRIAGSR